MENQEFQKLLIIVLIDSIKDYENSFYLYRALERMFDIYEYRNLIHYLSEENFINRSTIDNVYNYKISEKGVKLITEKKVVFIEQMKEKYMTLQPEYIKNILRYIE